MLIKNKECGNTACFYWQINPGGYDAHGFSENASTKVLLFLICMFKNNKRRYMDFYRFDCLSAYKKIGV